MSLRNPPIPPTAKWLHELTDAVNSGVTSGAIAFNEVVVGSASITATTGATSFTLSAGSNVAMTVSGNVISLSAPFVTHTHAASDINTGIIATNRLGTGTADSSSYLKGDQTWGTVTESNSFSTIAVTGQTSVVADSPTDTLELIAGTNISIATTGDTITISDTYTHPATHSADMITDGTTNKAYTAVEQSKLAGIEAGANNYTHPATHSADIIVDGTTNKAYTATEKTKLAGIEAGATTDMTANEILTAVKTVDGTGSGLDADLLDGIHATDFATSTHVHTGVYEPANANIQTHISSTSNPHSVTASQVGAIASSLLTTQGDLLIRGASALERLGIGTSGYYLKSQGTGANPIWAAVTGGSGLQTRAGSFTRLMSTASGNVSYTGVGFQPKLIFFFPAGATSTKSMVGIGWDNGSARKFLSITEGNAPAASLISGQAFHILYDDDSNVYESYAVVASMDSDGFTLTWTRKLSVSQTETIYYLALA